MGLPVAYVIAFGLRGATFFSDSDWVVFLMLPLLVVDKNSGLRRVHGRQGLVTPEDREACCGRFS